MSKSNWISTQHEENPHLRDLPALMIASQQCHVCWIPSFEQHEKREDFQAVVSAIHEITHENVICGWHLTAGGEEFEQIMKLAMNIATDLHEVFNVTIECTVKEQSCISDLFLTVTGLLTGCTLDSSTKISLI